MGELDGKVAVITGAGSGMGRAAAEVFVREGAKVLAADRSGAQEETAAALGDAASPFQVDVSDEAQVEAMFGAAVDAFGKVDAVLNVAGIAGASPLADLTVEDFDRFIGVNLTGVMLGTKHGIRTMLPTGGGVILNWSSTGGMNGSRLPTAAYSASKAAITNFTAWLAVHLAQNYSGKIRVNAIAPGFFLTEQNRFLLTDRETGAWTPRGQKVIDHTPMGRMGVDEDTLGAVLFLLSPASSFVTGITLPVDGGFSAYAGV